MAERRNYTIPSAKTFHYQKTCEISFWGQLPKHFLHTHILWLMWNLKEMKNNGLKYLSFVSMVFLQLEKNECVHPLYTTPHRRLVCGAAVTACGATRSCSSCRRSTSLPAAGRMPAGGGGGRSDVHILTNTTAQLECRRVNECIFSTGKHRLERLL